MPSHKRRRGVEQEEAQEEGSPAIRPDMLYKEVCQHLIRHQQDVEKIQSDMAKTPDANEQIRLCEQLKALNEQIARLQEEKLVLTRHLVEKETVKETEKEKRKTVEETEKEKRKTVEEIEKEKRKTVKEIEKEKRKTAKQEIEKLKLEYRVRIVSGSVQEVEWQEVDVNSDRIGFRKGKTLFCLDRSLLRRPNQLGATGECLLYCREDFKRQWQFLEQEVCQEGCLGYILGPPGTGKTTTTLAFLHSLDVKEWSVMCMRLWELDPVTISQTADGKTRMCEIDPSVACIKQILTEWPGDGKKFLFLDGYLHRFDKHNEMKGACNKWRNGDRNNRRLLVTTSLNSRGKTNREKDTDDKAQELVVYSWTLEEYKRAVKSELLYSNVADVIKDGVHSDRESLIEAKYQVVGGSCRYMFENPTQDAVQDFRRGMESIGDYDDYLQFRIGERSESFVNRLFARYRVGTIDIRPPVSKFVATELASKIGESFVNKLMNSGFPNNPVVQGFAFEMLFFARASRGQQGLIVTDPTKREQGNEQQVWGSFDVVPFDPQNGYIIAPNNRVCLKPEAWNQGGYDAVMIVERDRMVRFVQVTTSEKHDLKLQYFSKCLQALSMNGDNGWNVEIVFVVPQEKVETFQWRKVGQPGALSKYGWKAGSGGKKVDVVGMDSIPHG